MKRIWTALLLALVIAMSLGMYALAGTFDGYWDFEQPDGNYAYGFERVLVTMDEKRGPTREWSGGSCLRSARQ